MGIDPTEETSGQGPGAPQFLELLSDPALDVILLLSFLGGIGMSAASPALPKIAETFAIPDSRIGLVMSTFTLGALVILPVSGILMDAYGRRPVILTLLLLFGIAGTAIAVVRSFDQILLLRFLQGMGFAGTIPLSIAVVGDLYSGAAGSTAQGIRSSASGIARITIPGIAGFLASIDWFYPFLLNGTAIVAFGLAYLYLPESGATTGGLAPATDGSYRSYLQTGRDGLRDLGVILRDPTLLVLLGGVFVIFLSRFTIATFVPLYAVRSLGSSYVEAGLALSVAGIGRVIVSPFAGSFATRVSQRTAFVSTITVTAGGIVFVGLIDSLPLLYAVLLVSSTGNALYNPLLNNEVSGIVSDAHRGRVVSIMEMLKTGAITLSPVVFGAVLALIGFETMFVIAGGLALLPALLVIPVLDG